MNNEPVAWMNKIATSWVTTTPDEFKDEWIPLYTHPAELTDEEIGDFEYQIIRACGLSTANSDINPIGLRQIIKAILKKGTGMNANELADLLADSNDPDIRRAVAMLRQQQAEIEALKVKAHEWYLIAMEKAQEK